MSLSGVSTSGGGYHATTQATATIRRTLLETAKFVDSFQVQLDQQQTTIAELATAPGSVTGLDTRVADAETELGNLQQADAVI